MVHLIIKGYWIPNVVLTLSDRETLCSNALQNLHRFFQGFELVKMYILN